MLLRELSCFRFLNAVNQTADIRVSVLVYREGIGIVVVGESVYVVKGKKVSTGGSGSSTLILI